MTTPSRSETLGKDLRTFSHRPDDIKLNLPEAEVLSDHCYPLGEAEKQQTDRAVAQLLGRNPPSQL